MSLPSSMADFVPCDRLLQKAYLMFYYPTAPRRVQITPKTSTNITLYLYSRGPVRQVLFDVDQSVSFPRQFPSTPKGVTTLSWWGGLRVSMTPRAMSAGVLYSW